jgi:hypothetical protein
MRAARAAFLDPGLADIQQASRVDDEKHRVILRRPVPQIPRLSPTSGIDERSVLRDSRLNRER